ncbi:Lipocalin/cytosolic fatty-acid binding domain [Trinorchestia longiramus]|nr:Lipocalin/cytosolic fatty-acid binding domain [Trinorchestia longiramus]
MKVLVVASILFVLGGSEGIALYSSPTSLRLTKRQAIDDTFGTAPKTIIYRNPRSPTDQPLQCPKPPIVQNFQPEKYLGRWFEIERFETPFQTGHCVTADYTLLSNCSIGVSNTQVLSNGTVDVAKGVAHSAGDPSQGSLTVSFPEEERQRGKVQSPGNEGNYNILATDYVNYAVVYSCSIADIRGKMMKFEFSWILARLPRVNTVFLQRLHQWLQNVGVPVERYARTQQARCKYTTA